VLGLPLKAFKFEPQEFGEDSNLPKAVYLKDAQEATDSTANVWVLRDGKLQQTAVEIGESNGIYRQVISGLKQGDKVALQYNEVTVKETSDGTTEENPFMPKPPGSNKESKQTKEEK
jgi:HlyD family secretion protein